MAVRASIGSKVRAKEEVGSGGDGGNNTSLVGDPLIESGLIEGTSNNVFLNATSSESHGGDGMVLEVLSNTRKVSDDGDTKSLQLSSRSNARKLEDLGGANGTSGDNDLLVGTNGEGS